jgi:hypothetical protein
VITDVLELQLLSQLQAKREAEARVQSQQAWGVKHLAGMVNRMASAPTSTPSPVPTPSVNGTGSTYEAPAFPEIHAPGAIQNRSPITNNHYYNATPPVTPGPVVIEPPAPASKLSPLWLLAIPLVLGSGLLAYYLLKPAPAPTPPEAWQGQTTIKLGDAP